MNEMHETPYRFGTMADVLPSVPAILSAVDDEFGLAFSGVVLSDSIDPGYGSELLDRSMVDADTILDRMADRWGGYPEHLTSQVCTVTLVRQKYMGVALVIDWCGNQA